MAEEVVEEYTASLADLTFNSKPLINMLTMLAEDNALYSEQIVQVIEAHMQKVSQDKKLPALYLMDSIMKNVRQSNYQQLFAKNIVNNFVAVFEKVDEKRRQAMFKLRQTWTDICPAKKLYALDVRVNQIDPAWPVTAPPPEASVANIHINPRFLMKKEQDEEEARRKLAEEAAQKQQEAAMRQQLLSKQQELLKLQQQRLELELAEARSQLQQQAKQLQDQEAVPTALAPAAQGVQLQVLPMPEIEAVPLVNHFTPQAQVAPQPSTAPLTIPTTAQVNQQDPRLVRDPRLANRDPRSSAPPQWQTAVVHPAVQNKPQVVQNKPQVMQTKPQDGYGLPMSASSIDDGVVSPSKSGVSLSSKESKDEKAKKPTGTKSMEKLNKKSDNVAKKEDGSAPKKIEKKTDKDSLKKDDKPGTSGAATKAVESVHKATSSTTSSHEKRSSRATSHSRSRNHVGDRSKEKVKDAYKDAKVKNIRDGTRSRSRSPRITTRLPREHADYDRRYRGKRGSFEADRHRRSREGSPTEKKETMSLRSAEKHKLGRGHPLENNARETRPWKGKADKVHVEVTGEKVADTRDTGPVAKRLKRQENCAPLNEKHEALPDDLADLFGSEDKDYRRMGPPVTPKLDVQAARATRNSMDILPSPKQEEWKRFKESRPGDFPFAQPREDVDIRSRDVDLRQPLTSPGCGMPSMRRPFMSRIPKITNREDGKDLVIPKQLRLDHAEIVLKQAEEQMKRGTLSHDAHRDLKMQLDRLYILQEIRQAGRDCRAEMDENRLPGDKFNRPRVGYFDGRGPGPKQFWGPGPARRGRMEETMGSPAHFPGGSNSPHYDTDERRPNRGPLMPTPRPENDFVEGKNMRPQRLPNNGPRFEQDSSMGFRGDVRFPPKEKHNMPLLPPPLPPLHPHPRQNPLLPSPGNNHPEPPREFSFTDHPWYDTDRHYVFEHDKRWMMRMRQRSGSHKSYEVVIDGKSFEMMLNNRQRIIRIGNEPMEVRIDLHARRVFIGLNLCYWIGSPEITETINGQRHQIHFRGPIKRLWIDGHQYELWMDAPPEKIVIADVEYSMRIDSLRGVILVNDTVVCQLTEHPQNVKIGNNIHEIYFNQPSKQILIDGKLCELNFSGKFPVVIINGKAHGIRFDGGTREILVNGKPWTVAVDQPRKARLAGPRPYLIALGGPGHEVIIDDQWYVVKFNGPEVFFTLGYRKFRIQLKGSAPEVKILGEVISPEQAVEIYGPKPIQPMTLGPQPMPPRPLPLAPRHGMAEPGCNDAGFRPGGGPPFQQMNDRFGPPERPGFPSPHHDESFQGRRNNSVPSLLDMDVKPLVGMKNEPHREGPPHGVGAEPNFGQPWPLPPREPGPDFTGRPRQDLMRQPRFEGPRGPFPDTRPNMALGGPFDGPRQPFMDGRMGQMPAVDQPVQPMMLDIPMNTNMPASMMPGQSGMPPMMNSQQQPMPVNPMFGSMPADGMQVGGGGLMQTMPGQMVPGQMQTMGGMNFMQQLPQQHMTPGANPGSAAPGMMQGQGGAAPQMNSQVDVDDLLTKLMAAGIINKDEPKPEVKAEVKADEEGNEKTLVKEEIKKIEEIKFDDVPDVTDFDIQKMKQCYKGVLQRLYVGIQCSSCGVRFMATDTEQYREHLDWHFRQNRKEKEEIKMAKFRRWYYAAADWIQFEEIGDAEEHAQSNYFENMLQLAQEQQGFGSLPGQTQLISCPAALGNEKDDVCAICGDPFEQFWDEEQEAWHLKDAIRVNGETYHPVCYEDAKESGLGDGLTSPDAQQQQHVEQQQQQQQQQQQSPPDPITNPLGYLTMLNQQKQQQPQEGEATPATTTTVSVTVKQEPMDTCEKNVTSSGVTTVSSGQASAVTATVTTTVKDEPADVTVKSETVSTTTCVSQPSSTNSEVATSTTTTTPSQETAAKQADSTGSVQDVNTEPKS